MTKVHRRQMTALLGVLCAPAALAGMVTVNVTTPSGAAAADAAPRLRDKGWAYALAILLLCAEWILRRRRGMR